MVQKGFMVQKGSWFKDAGFLMDLVAGMDSEVKNYVLARCLIIA